MSPSPTVSFEAFAESEHRGRDGGGGTKPEAPHQAEASCSILRVWRAGAHKRDFQSWPDFFNSLIHFATNLQL